MEEFSYTGNIVVETYQTSIPNNVELMRLGVYNNHLNERFVQIGDNYFDIQQLQRIVNKLKETKIGT